SGQKLGQAFGGLIDLYYENKKFAEAEKLCQEFLELDGDDNVARMQVIVFERLIHVLARENKVEEANKLLDTRLKKAPGNWFLLELKGYLQHETGQMEEAAKTYEDVLVRIQKEKLDDDVKEELSSSVRYTLSGVYVDLDKIDKAAEQLKTLLAKEPNNPTYNN